MNPKTNPNQTAKPKLVVPQTEISQREAVSAGKYYLVVGLIMVGILLVGGYFINSLFQQYIKESNKIKAQDKTISLYNKKVDDLAELESAYNAIKEKKGNISDAERIMKALPAKEEYRSLIAMVENISNSSGVKLNSVSNGSSGSSSASGSSAPAATPSTSSSSSSTPGASSSSSSSSSSTTAKPQKLVFTVSIQGPYDRIIKFLENTEKSARVVNFRDMKLGGEGNEITADLTMETYWQPEAKIDSTYEELK